MLKAYGRLVATEPFGSKGIEAEVKSGFASIKNKVSLKPLLVLAGNDRIEKGSLVYVGADMFKADWALRIYENDGKAFILVPEDLILMVEDKW